MTPDPLGAFLPAVGRWFRQSLGEPTPVQRLGWPRIANRENALLLAPTGSGKTLAAFLACLDRLWRAPEGEGVRVLYVSPLKALNADIRRNLEMPLQGVVAEAMSQGEKLPALSAAVRTGDTPQAERQRLVRKPPQILITTPESLHLMLTSRARESLRRVEFCIVDEIHALCPNKRGVFLAILLERLQAIHRGTFARIGLSATQRPLDKVARFLGGQDASGAPRPVAIVDAGLRKALDLQVVKPTPLASDRSIWPAIVRTVADEIEARRSTIVFANTRRVAERTTAMLNDEFRARAALAGAEPLEAKAHHGSVSLEVRRDTETALKSGALRAVVATASLELGIDMGAVESVVQIESPGSVARGLQRVGRAGHVVGQQSRGLLIVKSRPDLVAQAVLAAEMAAGAVEPIRTPRNCLDVLAQQIVAIAALDEWRVDDLYRLVRQAYPFRDLPLRAFDATLEMVTGRCQWQEEGPAPEAKIPPRASWDRVAGTVRALPGSRSLAVQNGGAIPDAGQYAVVTSTGKRIGEVDEEFAFERRVGDVFLLGTSPWRVDQIDRDRIVVAPAEGANAMAPFWRGEQTGRSFDLGVAQGKLLAEIARRVADPDLPGDLAKRHFLAPDAALALRDYVGRQLRHAETVPTDTTFVVEASRDGVGDWQVFLLTPFGARFHLTLRLALENALRERFGFRPLCVHQDDGILLRFSASEAPPLDLFSNLGPDDVERRVLDELADSELFVLRFRHNAARALLMPRPGAGRRAPLWLQRLRGRQLLEMAKKQRDFPIVVETVRECLESDLDVPRVRQALADVARGAIAVKTCRVETPSPFAAEMLLSYQMAFMYVYDVTDAEPGGAAGQIDSDLLAELIAPSTRTDPAAELALRRRLRGASAPPRSEAEAAELLRRLGDLSDAETEGPLAGFLPGLAARGVAQRMAFAGAERWVHAEEADAYRAAFSRGDRSAAARVLGRFVDTYALASLPDALARYPFDPAWAEETFRAWSASGRLVETGEGEPRFATPENFRQLRRATLARERRETSAVPPFAFADFLLRWQHVHPDRRLAGPAGIETVLDQLAETTASIETWERAILPARVSEFRPAWLDLHVDGGAWVWCGAGDAVTLLAGESLADRAAPALADADETTARTLAALERRGALFVADLASDLGLAPSAVRRALWSLARAGLVTNDRFDVARRGEPAEVPVREVAPRRESLRRVMRPGPRRAAGAPPEGRWSRIACGAPTPEVALAAWARRLLARYGVVARALVEREPSAPPWRRLYDLFARLELADEVRRGQFVDGLDGAQFALPEAARMLADLAGRDDADAPIVVLAAVDPANLYGGPFDAPALDGERTFARRPGNWVALRAGRPALLAEQHGKRLTPAPGVPEPTLAVAVRRLATALAARGDRRVTVDLWAGAPATASPGRALLEAAGFVADYRSMTWYADLK